MADTLYLRRLAAILDPRFAQARRGRSRHANRCGRDLACLRAVNRQEPNHAGQHPFFEPDSMQKPPGYSHVVQVTGPGRTVYFAGQLGIDKSGKMGANAREQMEIAFENVKAALASVGASFDNVVKLNNYIIDIGTNIAHYREVRDKYVNTAAPPASTTIGVPQLARPGALFEVEAIAVLPPK
jgi:enamine deaminase RidA (YjgF/YER057c/UK114 family)